MAGRGALFQKIRRAGLCGLLSLMLLVAAPAPRPAAAYGYVAIITSPLMTMQIIWEGIKDAYEWAQANTEYGQYIDALITYYETIKETFDSFMTVMSEMDDALLFGMATESRTHAEIHQAVDDNTSNATLLAATTRLGLRTFTPKNEYLCKAVTALSGSLSIVDYQREVSRMATEAVNNRYRCPTCDGSGPDYTGLEMKRRCDTKRGNPRESYAQSCQGSMKGTDGRDGVDADVYSAVDGGQIITMPKIVSQAYVDPVSNQSLVVNALEPSDDRQRFWIAAWDHCFIAAGPRPTPPHGAAMKKPQGKTARAMFNHCAASQNALIKQCTDRLAYFTRPNCGDASALCDKQKNICESVRKMMDVSRFDNCGKGLSAYEQALIAQTMCKTKAHAVSQGNSGATPPSVMTGSDLCEISWSSWQGLLQQYKENYATAMAGLITLKPCWAQVESLSQGADAAPAFERNEEYVGAPLPVGSFIVPAKAQGARTVPAGDL